MKLGSNDIGSVYIGSTAVNKIYIGSTEVWTSFTGLLDTYTGAAAAYSLRQLKSGVTNAIRVRRASDNAETNIGFVSGQLDTTTLETFCSGTNGFVTTWYDQSGNGNDATQTTASNQPQIVSSGSTILENGKPCVRFDGTDDTIYTAYAPSSNAMSVYNVYKSSNNASADTNTQTLYNFGNATVTGYGGKVSSTGFFSGEYITFNFNDGRLGSSTYRRTTQVLEEEYWRTTGFSAYQNDVQYSFDLSQNWTTSTDSSPSALSFGTNYLSLCSLYVNSSFIGHSNINLQEIVIYDSDQSSNRSGIETNINAQYQIYWDGSQTSLLDTYGGSAAAYSLRALSSNYTGALIKVRRASDNAEQDIYAKYDGTLNTDALESFCSGTNGFVTTWYDQSGNGNDATQSTAAEQPQIVSGGSTILENGKPTLTGTFKKLISNSTILQDTFEVISVCNIQEEGYIADLRGGAVNVNMILGRRTTAVSGWLWNGSTFLGNASSVSINTQILTDYLVKTTSATYYQNGLSIETISHSVNTSSNIGFRIDFLSANVLNMQELIMYNSDQSSNRSGISDNINAQYQIYWDGSQTSLLDTYGGSAAAYSLRALSSSYTGALIKVRRASDNAEQDIYAKYDGTLNTDALESFCSGTNGFVTTWYDQSGNSNNATQSTSANQPQIVSSGSVILENGKPSVQFDGSNDTLIYSGEILNQSTFVGFAVVKNNATTGTHRIFDQSNNNGGSLLTNGVDSFADTFGVTSGGLVILTDTQYYTNQVLQVGQILSGNSKLRINAVDRVTDTTTFTMSGDTGINFVIGDNSPPNGQLLNANLQEIVIYTTDNNSNINSIETNINNHYNIY